jgi:predicted N-acetyltransferase YhbS
MITARELLRTEVEQVWSIDRREVINNIYYLENGSLKLRPEYYDMRGWPTGEADLYTPLLYECFDRGGWFYGLFDDKRLIGIAILDSQYIGREKDQLQLKFLHISRDYRKNGYGRQLFELSKTKARSMGARQVYISATPSENTVNFYLQLGAVLADEADPELLALEPGDIHMTCEL